MEEETPTETKTTEVIDKTADEVNENLEVTKSSSNEPDDEAKDITSGVKDGDTES